MHISWAQAGMRGRQEASATCGVVHWLPAQVRNIFSCVRSPELWLSCTCRGAERRAVRCDSRRRTVTRLVTRNGAPPLPRTMDASQYMPEAPCDPLIEWGRSAIDENRWKVRKR